MLGGKWRARLLGGLEVRQDSGAPIRFRTRKAAALFARLAVSPGRAFSREELVELLWPDAEPDSGRQNLRQALSTLRASLEPPGTPPGSVLEADRLQVKLSSDALESDVSAIDEAVQSAEPDRMAQAATLYRGEFLPGHMDDWVLEERRRVAEQYLALLRTQVQRLRTDSPAQALPYAQSLVAANPLDEQAQGSLIRLYADAGRPEDALQQYRAYRQILRKELGEEPDPRIKELAMTLKGAGGKLDIQELPTEDEAAPPKASRRASLPVHLSRIFGRESDLESLNQSLTQGDRLITLTGPGGSGKTRLATEAARAAAEHFEQRVWFVPLADVRDPHLVLGRILDIVGGKPKQSGSLVDAIFDSLGGGAALLVLDNLEQVLPGATHSVQALVSGCPELSVLATSRRPFGLPGEQVFPVERLAVPERVRTPGDLAEVPSAQLFYDRASRAAPGFRISDKNVEAVATLCRQLEGLPLAIELAAAWTSTQTPGQMVERMRQRFELLQSTKLGKEERHASLWAAIDWSYSMLRPAAQRLFTRLSVFRGGWDWEAATQVCKDAEPLEELRLHALVYADPAGDEMRWNMLESLREFAAAQLPREDHDALVRRHAEVFAQRALEWHELQRGTEQERINARFQEEIDNLWAVIDRGIEGQVPLDRAYEVVNGAYRFWEMRGAWAAMRRAYERLIESDTAKEPTKHRALALISLANLMRQQGEPELAIQPTEECMRIREQLGDRAGVSSALGHLAQVHKALGDNQKAKQFYLQCLAIQEELGSQWSWAMNCMNLGWLLVLEESWDEAETWLTKAHAAMTELGDKWGIAATTGNLAEVAVGKGDLDTATRLHRESLDAFRDLEDFPALAEELEALAHIMHLKGGHTQAARLYGAAQHLRADIGSAIAGQEAARLERRRGRAEDALQHFASEFQQGERLSLDEAVALAGAPMP